MNLTTKEKQHIAERRRDELAGHLTAAARCISDGDWHNFRKCMERAGEALRLAEEAQ